MTRQGLGLTRLAVLMCFSGAACGSRVPAPYECSWHEQQLAKGIIGGVTAALVDDGLAIAYLDYTPASGTDQLWVTRSVERLGSEPVRGYSRGWVFAVGGRLQVIARAADTVIQPGLTRLWWENGRWVEERLPSNLGFSAGASDESELVVAACRWPTPPQLVLGRWRDERWQVHVTTPDEMPAFICPYVNPPLSFARYQIGVGLGTDRSPYMFTEAASHLRVFRSLVPRWELVFDAGRIPSETFALINRAPPEAVYYSPANASEQSSSIHRIADTGGWSDQRLVDLAGAHSSEAAGPIAADAGAPGSRTIAIAVATDAADSTIIVLEETPDGWREERRNVPGRVRSLHVLRDQQDVLHLVYSSEFGPHDPPESTPLSVLYHSRRSCSPSAH